jgi:hypothetical protein
MCFSLDLGQAYGVVAASSSVAEGDVHAAEPPLWHPPHPADNNPTAEVAAMIINASAIRFFMANLDSSLSNSIQ